MKETRYGYMCATAFDWELGEALGGTRVYATIEDLKDCQPCVKQCGIVKVKVELEEVIQGDTWMERMKGESNE
jgi:hypothetical protein